jgi:RNA polymerase sigma-70 factor (ECF subfamily)
VLEDAFGLSLEENGEALSTTPGAVKAALHRGRSKLVTPELEEPTPATIDVGAATARTRRPDAISTTPLRQPCEAQDG